MSDKLTQLYNRVHQEREQALSEIATKADVERREGDRRKYPPVPEHNYPPPGWQDDPKDEQREWMRENEREIHRQNKQLTRASDKLEQDFERSR